MILFSSPLYYSFEYIVGNFIWKSYVKVVIILNINQRKIKTLNFALDSCMLFLWSDGAGPKKYIASRYRDTY